ncbi:MAG TPA: UrcA family protein [Steroidobacteraceae bacterium]|nr:UrcA family protein [Steroidobacteraceae bacterium]
MSICKQLLQGVSVSVLLLACAAAYADSPPSVAFQHASLVRFTDLSLDRPGDVAKLYERITAAADKVCGPRSLTGSYSKSGVYASCYADAVSQAVARVNHPALTAYYEQRTPSPARALAIAQK